jgi:Uma2 family endonuclease
MSAALKLKFSPRQYLEMERAAAYKSQYYDGEIFAMAGSSPAHVRINSNFMIESGIIFKSGPCYPLNSDLKVRIPDSTLYTYPDLTILCEPMQFEDEHEDVLLNPKIIVEILSPTTERFDRGKKFERYQRIPSLLEYILVSQDAPHIDRFHRIPDGLWQLKSFHGLEAMFEFATIPGAISMADIFNGVEFNGEIVI